MGSREGGDRAPGISGKAGNELEKRGKGDPKSLRRSQTRPAPANPDLSPQNFPPIFPGINPHCPRLPSPFPRGKKSGNSSRKCQLFNGTTFPSLGNPGIRPPLLEPLEFLPEIPQIRLLPEFSSWKSQTKPKSREFRLSFPSPHPPNTAFQEFQSCFHKKTNQPKQNKTKKNWEKRRQSQSSGLNSSPKFREFRPELCPAPPELLEEFWPFPARNSEGGSGIFREKGRQEPSQSQSWELILEISWKNPCGLPSKGREKGPEFRDSCGNQLLMEKQLEFWDHPVLSQSSPWILSLWMVLERRLGIVSIPRIWGAWDGLCIPGIPAWILPSWIPEFHPGFFQPRS
nr:uncharacterized protein LOC113460555 [Zonotrichia albicollis]